MINLYRYVKRISPKCYGRTIENRTLMQQIISTSREHSTVGLIVIGDEILKGQVNDSNAFYASKLLYKHGMKVQKISIIPDNIDDIAVEIKYFSERFKYVFTSGGIGPTHDDVTYQAVAVAFDDILYYHPTLMHIIKNRLNFESFSSSVYKMAYVPSKCTLKFGMDKASGKMLSYPCVTMENVYILPGSPMFFKISFQALCTELFAKCSRFATSEIYVNAKEESFADILSAVAKKCSNVSFGSYPEHNRYYKVRITIESERKEDTERARKMFCDRMPANVLVPYDRVCHVDCLAKFEKLLEESSHRKVYEKSFKKFVNYYTKVEEVWLYLDDSEEAIIMIHLARVANNKLGERYEQSLRAICLKSRNRKSDMKKFFDELSERYNIQLCNIECDESDPLEVTKQWMMSKAEFRTLLIGKRLNSNEREIYDNIARLSESISMPVQVDFPLIDWTNEDVASFLYSLSLPCYTSKTE